MNRVIIVLFVLLIIVALACLREVYRIRCHFTLAAEVSALRADVDTLIEKDVARGRRGRRDYFDFKGMRQDVDKLKEKKEKEIVSN